MRPTPSAYSGTGSDTTSAGNASPTATINNPADAGSIGGASPYVIDGTASGRARIPVVPGVPTRIIVSEPGSDTPAEIVTPLAQECAEVGVIVEPDCTLSSAEVSVQRDGIGRERFVVLLDGALAGVLAIDGTGTGAVPVALGDGPAELSVSRSMSAAPIVVGTLSCERDDGIAGFLAASLVVIAVIASAAAVVPWPSKLRFPAWTTAATGSTR